MNSLWNEDPNQPAYQGQESQHYADNNDQSNDIKQYGAKERFDFDTNLFEKSNEIESDDFYGRTREIIIFSKKGKTLAHCNHDLAPLRNTICSVSYI